MYGRLRDACEAGVDGLASLPFIDQVAVRQVWNDLAANRQHNYWMKPMLLVSLGTYADLRKRTSVDSTGAIKVRPPRMRPI
jgi:hypothetical protein